MNKNELELQKLTLGSANLRECLSFLKHVVTVGGVIFCVKVMISGIENIATANPESLTALAPVVEKMQLGTVMGYLVAAVTSCGWLYERKGKRRAYRKLGEYRRIVESGDPCNASSGLTATGDTPNP